MFDKYMTSSSHEHLYHSQRGLTLVEVLVSVVILSVGLLAVATMISRSTIQDSRSYYATHANMFAEELLENATQSQYDVNQYKNMTAGNFSRTIDGVEYTMMCVLLDDTPMNKCKEMRCSVNWNNKGLQSSSQYVYVFSPKY